MSTDSDSEAGTVERERERGRPRFGHHGVLDSREVGDERAVRRRADYLASTTDLELKHSKAVAWAELGWSVPKAMGIARSTAVGYLKRVRAQYGDACTYATHPENRRDLDEVTPADLVDAPRDVREVFREAAADHPEVVPAEVRGALADDDVADSEVEA